MIGASSYEHHYQLTQAAFKQQAHWLDLGGNNTVVAKQRALDERAKQNGLVAIPDCGLAPGMVSILGWELHQRFEHADTIALRVGGLPSKPANALGYQLVFSARGLLNEYREPCTVLRDGSLLEVPPMTELETLSLGQRFPRARGFHDLWRHLNPCRVLGGTHRKCRLQNDPIPRPCTHHRHHDVFGLL